MDMLRRLAMAPGRLYSPTDEDETTQGISQQLQASEGVREDAATASRSSLRPGEFVPGELTFEASEVGAGSSSSFRRRASVANTSMAPSEVGQGRRAARQSQADALLFDVLARDTSMNRSGMSPAKTAVLSSPGPMFEVRDDESTLPLDAPIDYIDDDDAELVSRLEGKSSRRTSLASSTRRFEDIETRCVSGI